MSILAAPVRTIPAEDRRARDPLTPDEERRRAGELARGRYVTDRPRTPTDWPVLTPDGGILMASTEHDALRLCATLNELVDYIGHLHLELNDAQFPRADRVV
jgi:hypothetical protein